MAVEESTPAERAASSQPSVEDYANSESSWGLNHKILADSHQYDNRVMNLNEKVVADEHARAMAYIDMQERMVALQERQLQMRMETNNYWRAFEQNQQLFADQRGHQATLNNMHYTNALGASIVGARVIEPTREEVGQDIAQLSAVRQTADVQILNTMNALLAEITALRVAVAKD